MLAQRRRLWAPALLFLVCAAILLSKGTTYDRGQLHDWLDHRGSGSNNSLPLVPELEAAAQSFGPVDSSPFCRSRYGLEHVTSIRDRGAIQYCNNPSSSSRGGEVFCFHGHNPDVDGKPGADRVDTACLVRGAIWDRGAFSLPCDVRRPTEEEFGRGQIAFDQLGSFWYETGPKALFGNVVRLEAPATTEAVRSKLTGRKEKPARYTIVVKREPVTSMWHHLMEVFSAMITIDVLRVSRDPSLSSSTSSSFYPSSEEVVADTQILFVNHELSKETFADQWHMLAGRPHLQLRELVDDPAKAREAFGGGETEMIIPFPGGSNPLWQNDWVARDCAHAPLVRAFAGRVLRHFGLGEEKATNAKTEDGDATAINVTFVDRQTRRVLGTEQLIEALRTRYFSPPDSKTRRPKVNIRLVDFGGVSFAEQLRVAQETDILVGGHGAGLTHLMFMRERRRGGAVVEIQPASLQHRGFRNLAVMFGHAYYVAHAAEAEAHLKKRGNPEWQRNDLHIDEGRFLELMDLAIRGLFSEGGRDFDAV